MQSRRVSGHEAFLTVRSLPRPQLPTSNAKLRLAYSLLLPRITSASRDPQLFQAKKRNIAEPFFLTQQWHTSAGHHALCMVVCTCLRGSGQLQFVLLRVREPLQQRTVWSGILQDTQQCLRKLVTDLAKALDWPVGKQCCCMQSDGCFCYHLKAL